MTRHFRHADAFAVNLDRPIYTLIADGEITTSFDREEIEDQITGLFGCKFTVLMSNPVEGMCRDVTDCFQPLDVDAFGDYPEYERAASAGDREYQLRQEGA